MNDQSDLTFLPLPEGSKIEISSRPDPFPMVGIRLLLGQGEGALQFSFTYTAGQAREIAAAIIECADQLDAGS